MLFTSVAWGRGGKSSSSPVDKYSGVTDNLMLYVSQ